MEATTKCAKIWHKYLVCATDRIITLELHSMNSTSHRWNSQNVLSIYPRICSRKMSGCGIMAGQVAFCGTGCRTGNAHTTTGRQEADYTDRSHKCVANPVWVTLYHFWKINTLRPSDAEIRQYVGDAYMPRWSISLLVQIMVCSLDGARPLI